MLSLLYKKRREQITKVPLGTDQEVRIHVTSTMTFNVYVVANYLRSLPSLSNKQQLLYAKQKIKGQQTQQRQTPRQPYSGNTTTNSSKLSGQSIRCVSCVGCLLYKVEGFNAPPVRCIQENVQMLTDRYKMHVSTQTSLFVLSRPQRLLPRRPSASCWLRATTSSWPLLLPSDPSHGR